MFWVSYLLKIKNHEQFKAIKSTRKCYLEVQMINKIKKRLLMITQLKYIFIGYLSHRKGAQQTKLNAFQMQKIHIFIIFIKCNP